MSDFLAFPGCVAYLAVLLVLARLVGWGHDRWQQALQEREERMQEREGRKR